MYGDTTTVRRLAGEFRERAEWIRAEAGRLHQLGEEVVWRGAGASRMRMSALERAAGMRRTADAHDEAAVALDRHAREVDRLTLLIAEIERRAEALVAEARTRLGALVDGVLPDGVDELLSRVELPVAGSREWLDLDLPGL